jgi:hypothetical protein
MRKSTRRKIQIRKQQYLGTGGPLIHSKLNDHKLLYYVARHALPLAITWSPYWNENPNHEQERAEMEAHNGAAAERLAACFHESGHVVVAFSRGAKITGLRVCDGLDGESRWDPPETWTWHDGLVVTAAGAAAKAKFRSASGTISFGLDGAGGDMCDFVFLTRLLDPAVEKRIGRLLRSESHARGERFPRMRECIEELITSSWSPLESGSWNQYVAEAMAILNFGWAWSSVELLATELNREGEIRPDRVNDLLQTQRERANGPGEPLAQELDR